MLLVLAQACCCCPCRNPTAGCSPMCHFSASMHLSDCPPFCKPCCTLLLDCCDPIADPCANACCSARLSASPLAAMHAACSAHRSARRSRCRSCPCDRRCRGSGGHCQQGQGHQQVLAKKGAGKGKGLEVVRLMVGADDQGRWRERSGAAVWRNRGILHQGELVETGKDKPMHTAGLPHTCHNTGTVTGTV